MLATVCRCLIGACVLSVATVGSAGGQHSTETAHPVVHLEILGADAPRLQNFYTALFGWKITLNPAGYAYVPVAPTPPATLTGGIGPSPQGRPLAVFYVKVDDPGAILRKVEALGGRVVVPPVEVPGGITFARFADPEGNVVGIVRRRD